MGPLILALTGTLFLGLGYLVAARGHLELLAGYRPERVRDKNALARWAGGGLALLGLWTLAGAVGLILGLGEDLVVVLWTAGLVLGTLVLVMGAQRFSS